MENETKREVYSLLCESTGLSKIVLEVLKPLHIYLPPKRGTDEILKEKDVNNL